MIVVYTYHLIRQVLWKPDLARRMTTWSVKPFEFSLKYEPRDGPVLEVDPWCTLYVNGSSNSKGGEASIIPEGPRHMVLEHSLKFDIKTFNNQVKYETLLVDLVLALEVRACKVLYDNDFQLIVKPIKGTYQVKKPLLL
ncbi:hypothetical protein CR513_05044, partial [Mucuna pruriens]